MFPCVVLFLSASVLLAQSTPPRPAFDEFEVATIKPATADLPGRYIRMQTAHQLEARNHTVRTLIAAAFNVSPQAIFGGPAWAGDDRYQILAKTPGEAKPNLDEQMAMLRHLLTDRFHLKFHRESRELPIYALTVAKSGSKLKETTIVPESIPQGPPPLIFVISPQGASLPARYATVADFASVLQRAAMKRPVVDQTGLSGRYDFDLKWLPDDTQFDFRGPWEQGNSDWPDLATALQQQLGLKIEATRGAVSVFVIDSVEYPSAN
jgi:uncharacterized protein (TIGR03435 family)